MTIDIGDKTDRSRFSLRDPENVLLNFFLSNVPVDYNEHCNAP